MAKAKKKIDTGTIELVRLQDDELKIPIKGVSPVIPHKWSEKSKRLMPGHPEKEMAKVKKELKKPEEEAEACLYRFPRDKKRMGMPATAFKAAMVRACSLFDKPSMVEGKQLIYVLGTGPDMLVEIKGRKELREDTPRNANGNADLRYRYAIHDWTATITVQFVATMISPESIIALLDAAGRGGVGDWRPSAPKSYTGTFGTWRVDDEEMK